MSLGDGSVQEIAQISQILGFAGVVKVANSSKNQLGCGQNRRRRLAWGAGVAG